MPYFPPQTNGLPSGTAFPSGPTLGQLFFRTDYGAGLLFVYDGTRWLTENVFLIDSDSNYNSTGPNPDYFPSPASYGLEAWVESFITSLLQINAGSAANYWTFNLNKVSVANVSTLLATHDTKAFSAVNWARNEVAVGQVLDPTAFPTLSVTFASSGAPGNIYGAARVRYRLIGV